MMSVGFLVAGFILFLIASVCYTVTAVYLLTHVGAAVPVLSLTQFGNVAGIGGMTIIPLFVVTAIIQNFRIKRREKDVGDKAEPGTAERSRSDRQDS